MGPNKSKDMVVKRGERLNSKIDPKGWIKLYRDITTKDIYLQDPLYARVFERLIMEANHACKRIPYKGGTKLIKRGERLTSIRQIAEWVGWYQRGIFKTPNPKTISAILDWMVSNNLIEIYGKKSKKSNVSKISAKCEQTVNIEPRSNSQETHYNIVNYCIYQSIDDGQSNGESNSQVTAKQQSMDTNNNVNNDKNVKKVLKDIYATQQFKPPTVEEVKEYCLERNNDVDSERWINHYTAKGWMIGKNKMKDWKSAVRTWERNSNQEVKTKSKNPNRPKSFDAIDQWDKMTEGLIE